MSNCKVIALTNQKGGVGKTTTAVNLGVGLVQQGKKVLLIDADAQANLTMALGYSRPDDLPVTLSTIMQNIIDDKSFDASQGIIRHGEGVDLLPSNIELSGFEVRLINAMSRERVLKTYVNEVKKNYDYVVIDCMPSLGMITINALAAADSVVIPTQPHYLSAKGLELLLRSVSMVKRQINPKLRIDGILMTMVMPRTNISKEITATVKSAYGQKIKVFDTEIPHSIRAVEATAEGKSIFAYDKSGKDALSVIEHPSGKKKPYALYQAEKQGRPTRDNVARQAVDEAISKSFTLKDFDRQLAEMGYRINFDPNRKYWTIIGKGWQRPKRLYKLGEEYTNDRIMERISENSYAVKFQSFSEPQPQVKVCRVKGSLKNDRKIGGLRGLYLHYCYKLGILPKDRKQNYARLHYLLKDDLMKMEAITQETRLLCRNHIDTAEQLCSYKGSLETEMSALLQKRKELYSKSRRTSGEEKEAVKAELSDISGRLKIIRKEVRLCEGISARSDTLKEKLQTIRADEHEQQRKELMKNEHRRRSGRTNRPNELGGL